MVSRATCMSITISSVWTLLVILFYPQSIAYRFFRQALGGGVFFDSWRRRTHPHVWILNTPVLFWYLADKYWCCTQGRQEAQRYFGITNFGARETPSIEINDYHVLHCCRVGGDSGHGRNGRQPIPEDVACFLKSFYRKLRLFKSK